MQQECSVVEVRLNGEYPWGFSIGGGIETNSLLFVTEVHLNNKSIKSGVGGVIVNSTEDGNDTLTLGSKNVFERPIAAEIRKGDIIIKINGIECLSMFHAEELLKKTRPQLRIILLRGVVEIFASVPLFTLNYLKINSPSKDTISSLLNHPSSISCLKPEIPPRNFIYKNYSTPLLPASSSFNTTTTTNNNNLFNINNSNQKTKEDLNTSIIFNTEISIRNCQCFHETDKYPIGKISLKHQFRNYYRSLEDIYDSIIFDHCRPSCPPLPIKTKETNHSKWYPPYRSRKTSTPIISSITTKIIKDHQKHPQQVSMRNISGTLNPDSNRNFLPATEAQATGNNENKLNSKDSINGQHKNPTSFQSPYINTSLTTTDHKKLGTSSSGCKKYFFKKHVKGSKFLAGMLRTVGSFDLINYRENSEINQDIGNHRNLLLSVSKTSAYQTTTGSLTNLQQFHQHNNNNSSGNNIITFLPRTSNLLPPSNISPPPTTTTTKNFKMRPWVTAESLTESPPNITTVAEDHQHWNLRLNGRNHFSSPNQINDSSPIMIHQDNSLNYNNHMMMGGMPSHESTNSMIQFPISCEQYPFYRSMNSLNGGVGGGELLYEKSLSSTTFSNSDNATCTSTSPLSLLNHDDSIATCSDISSTGTDSGILITEETRSNCNIGSGTYDEDHKVSTLEITSKELKVLLKDENKFENFNTRNDKSRDGQQTNQEYENNAFDRFISPGATVDVITTGSNSINFLPPTSFSATSVDYFNEHQLTTAMNFNFLTDVRQNANKEHTSFFQQGKAFGRGHLEKSPEINVITTAAAALKASNNNKNKSLFHRFSRHVKHCEGLHSLKFRTFNGGKSAASSLSSNNKSSSSPIKTNSNIVNFMKIFETPQLFTKLDEDSLAKNTTNSTAITTNSYYYSPHILSNGYESVELKSHHHQRTDKEIIASTSNSGGQPNLIRDSIIGTPRKYLKSNNKFSTLQGLRKINNFSFLKTGPTHTKCQILGHATSDATNNNNSLPPYIFKQSPSLSSNSTRRGQPTSAVNKKNDDKLIFTTNLDDSGDEIDKIFTLKNQNNLFKFNSISSGGSRFLRCSSKNHDKLLAPPNFKGLKGKRNFSNIFSTSTKEGMDGEEDNQKINYYGGCPQNYPSASTFSSKFYPSLSSIHQENEESSSTTLDPVDKLSGQSRPLNDAIQHNKYWCRDRDNLTSFVKSKSVNSLQHYLMASNRNNNNNMYDSPITYPKFTETGSISKGASPQISISQSDERKKSNLTTYASVIKLPKQQRKINNPGTGITHISAETKFHNQDCESEEDYATLNLDEEDKINDSTNYDNLGRTIDRKCLIDQIRFAQYLTLNNVQTLRTRNEAKFQNKESDSNSNSQEFLNQKKHDYLTTPLTSYDTILKSLDNLLNDADDLIDDNNTPDFPPKKQTNNNLQVNTRHLSTHNLTHPKILMPASFKNRLNVMIADSTTNSNNPAMMRQCSSLKSVISSNLQPIYREKTDEDGENFYDSIETLETTTEGDEPQFEENGMRNSIGAEMFVHEERHHKSSNHSVCGDNVARNMSMLQGGQHRPRNLNHISANSNNSSDRDREPFIGGGGGRCSSFTDVITASRCIGGDGSPPNPSISTITTLKHKSNGTGNNKLIYNSPTTTTNSSVGGPLVKSLLTPKSCMNAVAAPSSLRLDHRKGGIIATSPPSSAKPKIKFNGPSGGGGGDDDDKKKQRFSLIEPNYYSDYIDAESDFIHGGAKANNAKEKAVTFNQLLDSKLFDENQTFTKFHTTYDNNNNPNLSYGCGGSKNKSNVIPSNVLNCDTEKCSTDSLFSVQVSPALESQQLLQQHQRPQILGTSSLFAANRLVKKMATISELKVSMKTTSHHSNPPTLTNDDSFYYSHDHHLLLSQDLNKPYRDTNLVKTTSPRVKLLQKKEEEEDDWSSSSRNSKIIYENMTDILKAKNSRNSSIPKLENHLVDDKNFPSFTEDCCLTNQVVTHKAVINQLKYSSSRIKCLSSSGNKQKRMSLDCSSTLAAALLPTPDDTSVINNHRPPKLATLRGEFEKRKPSKAGKNKTYVPQFAPLPSFDHDDDLIQRSLGLDNKCNSNTKKPIITIIKGSHNSKADDDNSCYPDESSSRISKVTKTIQQVCQSSSNSNPLSSTIAISKESQRHRLLDSLSTGDKPEPTDSIIINPQNNLNKQCSTTKKLLISFRKNNNNSNKKNYGSSNTRKADCDGTSDKNVVQKIPDKIEACCKIDFSTQAAAKTHQHVDEVESNSSNGIPPPPSRSDSGYCSWDNSISYYHNNTDPLYIPLTTLAKNDLSSEEAGEISEASTREVKLLPTTLNGPTTRQAGQNSSSVAKLLKKGNSMKIPLKYCKSNFTSNSFTTTTITKTVIQPTESCKKSEIMSSKKIGPLYESSVVVNQKENYFGNQNNNHMQKIIQPVVPHQQGTIINFMDQDFEGAELQVRRLLPCVPEMLKEEKVDVEKQQQDDEFFFKSESEDGYCEEDNSIVNYYSPLKGLRLDKKEGGTFPFLDQENTTFKLLPMDHHHQQHQQIHNNLSAGSSAQNQPPDHKISSNVCYYSHDSDSIKKMGPNKVFFHVRQKSREECEFETLLRQNFTAEHDEQQQPDNSHDANPLNFYNLRNILTQDIDDNVLTDLYKTFNIPCNTTTNTNKNCYVSPLRHNGTVNDSNDRTTNWVNSPAKHGDPDKDLIGTEEGNSIADVMITCADKKLESLKRELDHLQGKLNLNDNSWNFNLKSAITKIDNSHEVKKIEQYLEDSEKIIALLTNLNVRLHRNNQDTRQFNESATPGRIRKSKLEAQHQDALTLKASIDMKYRNIDSFIRKFLTTDNCESFRHFCALRSKLYIEQRFLMEKIKIGEEQLRALQNLDEFS